MPVQTAIQVRRGTASSWTSTNPTLAAGEIGFETDTSKFKIGTGSTAWNSLNYFVQDPVTTKGDLYTFSTTDARLAVGNNGETLVADSSQTTGLRYNPPVGSLANPVINGGFDIWQRGTSFTASNSAGTSYWADRWSMFYATTTGITLSRQNVADSTNLPNIQYAARVQRANGTAGSQGGSIGQSIEIVNAIPFAGKAITFSFYARRGANYSASSNNLSMSLKSGTGTTDANGIYNTYTGQATVAGASATLTTSWQRFVGTGTVGSTATQLAFDFATTFTGTSGADDWFEVTGIQIDIGTYTASSAPTFRRSGGTLAGELAACQRYFARIANGADVTNEPIATGMNYSTQQGFASLRFPVPMRTTATATVSNQAHFLVYGANAAAYATNGLTTDTFSSRSCRVNYTIATTNLVAGNASLVLSNSASCTFDVSAEL